MVLTFSASNAQLSVTLTTPNPGDTVKANNIAFTVDITNTGSSAISTGDTIFYWMNLGTTTSPITFGGGGSWNIEVLTAPLAPGAKITKSALTGGFITPPTTATYTKVCAKSAVGIVAARNTATAASSCYWIDRSLASLNEKTLENSVKVFATTSVLNLSSTSNETLNYSVYSISGKLVTEGSFTSSKRVNLNLTTGIYAVVISNENKRITKKIVVQ